MLAVKTDSEKGGEGMELTVQVPKHAQEILEQLNNHGFEAYVVGGCVRDSLLHRVPGRLGHHHFRKTGAGEGHFRTYH